jgi:hypothetical protein
MPQSDFERSSTFDEIETPLVSSSLERGSKPGPENGESKLGACNPPSYDKHVGVVMGTAHARLKFVGAQRGAYPFESIGRYGHTQAGAAYKDTTRSFTALDPFTQQARIIRIVAGDISRAADVDHLQPVLLHYLFQKGLEAEPRVI